VASIEDKVREYRTIASQKQAQKAQAQAELNAANDRLAGARADLKTEFGVETSAEAKALQDQLNAEIAAAEAEIETLLQEAGA